MQAPLYFLLYASATGIYVTLRGKVQVQWKLVKNGAVYTVKNCHILMDHKQSVYGPGRH